MTKKLITIMLLVMFVLNIGAAGVFADGDNSENTVQTAVEVEIDNGEEPAQVVIIDVEAGTTPDQTFYDIKRLFEKVQLYLTFSSEDKAALLAEFAEKRLAEAQAMDEAGKLELVKAMVKDYAATLLKAQDKAEETVAKGLSILEIIEQIEKLLDENIEVLQKVKEEIPELEANLATIKENLALIKITSQIIEELEEKDIDSDNEEIKEDNAEESLEKENEKKQVIGTLEGLTVEEQVESLRQAGYGYGEIGLAFSLAEFAQVSIDEVVKLRGNGLGWGNISKELGIEKRDAAKKIGKLIVETKDQIINENGENTDIAGLELLKKKTTNNPELNEDIKKEIKNNINELKLEQRKTQKEFKTEINAKKEGLKNIYQLKKEIAE